MSAVWLYSFSVFHLLLVLLGLVLFVSKATAFLLDDLVKHLYMFLFLFFKLLSFMYKVCDSNRASCKVCLSYFVFI